jgi:hypothetical protein
MSGSHRKVVARYADGRIVKGYTFDFGPAQSRFHVFEQPMASGPSALVLIRDLKAVFFVRDLVGNPAHHEGQKFRPGAVSAGAHVEVRFRDGEVMLGTADSPTTDPQGFFLIPADPESNNLRVYVVAAATRAVYPLEPVARSGMVGSAGSARPAASPASVGSILPARLLGWLTR